jgi:uncharacterized SAM-binding protein YcdF (DUF218 family)
MLILLLGCHITRLLTGRVQSAVEFASNTNANTTIDWFLSGGIKEGGAVSEAELMVRMIESKSNNNTWNFILDTVATNTAENFIIANQTLNMSAYSDVFIVTSDFHHKRANAIASKVFNGQRISWILSPLEEPDSRYWERIHIKNVDADVKKSMDKMRIVQ